MGSKNREVFTQAATSTAVAWTFYIADDFDCKSITMLWDGAPTTSENVIVTLDSAQGAAYDTVLSSVDMVGKTSHYIKDLGSFFVGDKIKVAYANSNTRNFGLEIVYREGSA